MDFDMLGLPPRLAANLAALGLTQPTPIQKQAIPHAMNGRDVLGLAQTGTGKTAAFGLPLLAAILRMEGRPAPKSPRALILAPTRELAKQIRDSLAGFAEGTQLRCELVVGGASLNRQQQRLERGCDVLVATPGRLIDLIERRAVRLDRTVHLVLDEADQMLDLGFIHALRKIAPLLPADRQTALFSATMPKQMGELAQAYLTDPVRVETAPPGKPADKVTQSVHFVEQTGKTALLIDLLDNHRDEAALVFARTKHGAERLMKTLDKAGFATASVHGNKSQGQRERALAGFRDGSLTVLVATDVAARGIDVPAVRHVYNYDLPNVPENYVHRIGRTARAGRDGAAVAFCAPAEIGELADIEKTLGRALPVVSGTRWSGSAAAAAPKRGGRGGGKGGGGGGGAPGQSRRRARRPARRKAA